MLDKTFMPLRRKSERERESGPFLLRRRLPEMLK